MAKVISIGAPTAAPAGKRSSTSNKDSKGKGKVQPKPTQIVVQQAAPPAEEKKKRRGGRRNANRQSKDIMGRLDVKGKAMAIGGAYAGTMMLAGKSTSGIPNTLLAAAAVEYFGNDGRNDWARPVATGLAVVGAVEYVITKAIAEGKFNDLIKPYIESVIARGGDAAAKATALRTQLGIAATADATGYDEMMDKLSRRMASGG